MPNTTAPKTPTLDQLAAVAPQRNAIMEFLAWLAEAHKAEIAAYHAHTEHCTVPHAHNGSPSCAGLYGYKCPKTDQICGRGTEELYALGVRHETLVMQFLGVDMDKVEQERQALLESLRS